VKCRRRTAPPTCQLFPKGDSPWPNFRPPSPNSRKDFSGRLLLPVDSAWETARHLHNGYVDKRPKLIAQCLGSDDIASAVRGQFNRETQLHGLGTTGGVVSTTGVASGG
jgi:hypothetical protein